MLFQHYFLVIVLSSQAFLQTTTSGLGDLAKILAALSGDVECSFKCPSGE